MAEFNFKNDRYSTMKRSTLFNFLLKNIPQDNIIYNCELNSINYEDKINLSFTNNLLVLPLLESNKP